MRYQETDDDSTILRARLININDDILLIDGLEFPGRIGEDMIVQFVGGSVEILDMGGALLASVVLDDEQAGIDEQFEAIVGDHAE